MDEQWIKWEPIQGLSRHYYVDLIIDSFDGFFVVLTDAENENKKIEIKFLDSVKAYRSTDEVYRIHLVSTLRETHGEEFINEWALFKVKNSDYKKWLTKQSYDFFDSDTTTHFSIIGGESIVDIIANYDPIVEFKEK
ncbi:MAG: hypothetical protein JEZ00_21860 [Anaerolineaceae bacterium]|nr:hypothetical protein [Anaerolineaceae bacterium]